MLDFGAIMRFLRLLCAVALVSAGSVHHAPVAFAAADDVAAYTMPDGTLPVICLTASNESRPEAGDHSGSSCEACRLSSAALLPLPERDAVARLVQPIKPPVPERARFDAPAVLISGVAPRAPPAA